MQSPDTKRVVLYISPVETPRLYAWIDSLPSGQRSQIIRNVLAWAIESPMAGLSDLPDAPLVSLEPKPKQVRTKRAAKTLAPTSEPEVAIQQMPESAPVLETSPVVDSQLSTEDLAAFNKLWSMGG